MSSYLLMVSSNLLVTFFLGSSIGIVDAFQDSILPKFLLYTQDSFLTSAFLLSLFLVSFPLSLGLLGVSKKIELNDFRLLFILLLMDEVIH